MASMSDYLENEILDHILGTEAFTMPSGSYLALFTAAPSDAGGGTELSGNGYARQDVTWGAAASAVAANTSSHTFTASGGDWGTITHWAIFDAATTGNMLLHGALDASKAITDGQSLIFSAGDLDMTGA